MKRKPFKSQRKRKGKTKSTVRILLVTWERLQPHELEVYRASFRGLGGKNYKAVVNNEVYGFAYENMRRDPPHLIVLYGSDQAAQEVSLLLTALKLDRALSCVRILDRMDETETVKVANLSLFDGVIEDDGATQQREPNFEHDLALRRMKPDLFN